MQVVANTNKLRNVLHNTVQKPYIKGCSFMVASIDNNFVWHESAGNMSFESQYFIASTTKLYTTAIILQMIQEGKLSFNSMLAEFLDSEIMSGLHIFNKHDYSNAITIKHLLSHTSGLPDYFQGKQPNGKSLLTLLCEDHDQSWDFKQAIDLSKQMKPKFAPGTANKAFYSDTNYQLLGKIIEVIEKLPIKMIYENRIIKQLALNKTYLYTDEFDKAPIPMNYKNKPLLVPKAMTSFGADGGIVSNLSDSMRFIQAFFKGDLFDSKILESLKNYNHIFYPLEYGVGFMRFKLPGVFTLFHPLPEMLGHSGLSGALDYYCPEKELFIVGTVNQIAKPQTSYQTISKLVINISNTDK